MGTRGLVTGWHGFKVCAPPPPKLSIWVVGLLRASQPQPHTPHRSPSVVVASTTAATIAATTTEACVDRAWWWCCCYPLFSPVRLRSILCVFLSFLSVFLSFFSLIFFSFLFVSVSLFLSPSIFLSFSFSFSIFFLSLSLYLSFFPSSFLSWSVSFSDFFSLFLHLSTAAVFLFFVFFPASASLLLFLSISLQPQYSSSRCCFPHLPWVFRAVVNVFLTLALDFCHVYSQFSPGFSQFRLVNLHRSSTVGAEKCLCPELGVPPAAANR